MPPRRARATGACARNHALPAITRYWRTALSLVLTGESAWRRGRRITEPQVSVVLVQPHQGCMSREAADAPRHVKLHCTIAHTRAPLGRWSVRRSAGNPAVRWITTVRCVCFSRGGGQPAAILKSSRNKPSQVGSSQASTLYWGGCAMGAADRGAQAAPLTHLVARTRPPPSPNSSSGTRVAPRFAPTCLA